MNPTHQPSFYKVKSFYVKIGGGLTKDAIEFLVKFLNKPYCNMSMATFDLYGGAINNSNHNTSFIHRDNLHCIHIETNNLKCVNEINRFGKEFQSKFTSKYSNQLSIDRELDNWKEKYYGGIYERLLKIKLDHDPKNLFKFPQSIIPSED